MGERHRQHQAGVVVGVLAHQVDPAGRAADAGRRLAVVVGEGGAHRGGEVGGVTGVDESHAAIQPAVAFTHVRFLDDRAPDHDLTYDDVFMVPRHSSVSSRYDVDLATADGTGATIPLVVANMTAIAGKRMAETVARRGGLVVIPQDIPIPVVADVVAWVKQRHLVFDTPITLEPTQTVAEALSLMPKRSHRCAVVVQDGRPLGVVTAEDCAEVDRFAQAKDVMRPAEVTIPADTDPRAAFEALDAAHAPIAVGVDDDGRLVGVLTRTRCAAGDPLRTRGGRLRRAPGRRRGRGERRGRRPGRPAARGRRRLPGRRHRPRPPGPDGRGAGHDPVALARRCRWWRATWSRPRAPGT